MIEVWKDIENYETLYQVSNFGNIKSKQKITNGKYGFHIQREKIIKTHIHKSGYVIVLLCKKGKQKSYRVHRLVANAFLEKNKDKQYVNHINGIKNDNRVENLEWCSQKENIRKAIEQGLMTNKHRCKKIIKKKNGVIIEEYSSITEASKKTSISRRCLYLCINNKQKTSCGYEWATI